MDIWHIIKEMLWFLPMFCFILFILCIIRYKHKYGIDDWTFWYGSREDILEKKREYKEAHTRRTK